MKYRGKVINITDPENLGRIKVEISGYENRFNQTPWAWPCSPFAGPGYGFFCLPQIDDEVYVEKDFTNRWIYTGFFWSGRNPKPSDGSSTKRIFRSPAGHSIKFDETGDIDISHANGAAIILKANGDIILNGGDKGVIRVGDESVPHIHTIQAPNGPCTCSPEKISFGTGSQTVKAG